MITLRYFLSFKPLQFLLVLLLAFGLAVCAEIPTDEETEDGAGTQYSASGTYTYDSDAGMLTIYVTSSTFECDGPEVGTEQFTIDILTSTSMTWNDNGTWTRSGGTAGDITGTWTAIDDRGDSAELTLDSDGNFTFTADTDQCGGGYDDDGACIGSALTVAGEYILDESMWDGHNVGLASDGTSIYLYKQDYEGASSGKIWKIDGTGNLEATYNLSLSYGNTNDISWIGGMTWHNGGLWASGGYASAPNVLQQGIFQINLATGQSENQIPAGSDIDLDGDGIGGLTSDGTNFYVGVDLKGVPDDLGVVMFSAMDTEIPSSTFFLTDGFQYEIAHDGGNLWLGEGYCINKMDLANGNISGGYRAEGEGLIYFNDLLWRIYDTKLVAYELP